MKLQLEPQLEKWRRSLGLGLAAALCGLALSGPSLGCAGDPPPADKERPAEGQIEPRYQPREPVPEPWYDSSYLFGMTRGVADSTIHPAGKVPLFVLTIPLDIAFLPFAAIGGFF